MASAATFTSLQAPAQDDTMEMSSPANRTYDDDDIDIDFDDGTGGVNLTDDERMMEDGEQTRPPTATDDMMEDDVQPPAQLHVQESEMQDDFDPTAYEQANDEDDELIDYGDDEYVDFTDFQPQPVVEAAPPAPEIEVTDQAPAGDDVEQVDEEIVREPEEPVVNHEPELVDEVATEEPAQPNGSDAIHAEVSNVHEAHEDAPTVEDPAVNAAETAVTDRVPDTYGQEDVEEATLVATEDETGNAAYADDTAVGRPPPAPLNTSLSFSVDAPGTPTDTGLHPMTLHYGDTTWPLFKSRKQPNGILRDDNLASVSLIDLLAHCKTGLKAKVPDVSEDQEFSLFFEGLGLTVTEVCGAATCRFSGHRLTSSQNSDSAANTSLDEVLEVYKQLYANDGVQEAEIPTLSLTLSAHLRFSSLFAFYKQGLEAGQGMSAYQPSFDNGAHEDGETGAETTCDNDPGLSGANTGDEYYGQEEQTEFVEGEEDANGEVDYQDYDNSYEEVEGNNEEAEGHDQSEENADDQVDFTAYEEYAEDAAAEPLAAAEPGYLEANNDQPTEAANQAAETDALHDEQPANAELGAEATTEGLEGNANVESVASSTTLRGSNTNDAVGKYSPDDLIDWEDDSPLTTYTSEHGDDDDDLAFLAGLEGDEVEAKQELDQEPAAYEAGSGEQAVPDADASSQEATGDPLLGSTNPGHGEASQPTDGDQHQQAATEHEEAVDEEQLYGDDDAYDLNGEAFESDDQPFNPADDTFDDQQPHQEPTETVLNGEHREQATGHEVATGQAPEEAAKAQDGLDDFDEEPPPIPDDDSIDFDDDTTEQHEARKASQVHVSPSGNASPSGKRSFDETETADGVDERELKKARSS